MRLQVLADVLAESEINLRLPPGCGDLAISALSADSRAVEPGCLFAALPGAKADGSQFVAEAVARGAVAVLARHGAGITVPDGIALLTTPEPRQALARLAARFYGPQPATIVAVTGTSGKTSVADFARQIFARLGHGAASLGTLGVVKAGAATYGALTTPDPVTLHQTLARLAQEGITHLAMEASSHGLDQHRLDGVVLRAAAFTNLGRDHLDYHPSMADYLAAKLRLFAELLPRQGTAVINADAAQAPAAIAAAERAGRKVFSVGMAGTGLKLLNQSPHGFAQHLRVRCGADISAIQLPLLGDYQANNALLAAGLAIASGAASGEALRALEHLAGVRGRLEIVGQVRGGLIVIDYAHKPDALAAALRALKPFAPGRIVCVFGCGGDRDKGKRPIMGQIANALAGTVIVTDDNPRNEDPAAIRAEILAGAPAARDIGDRQEAIRAGVRLIGHGDVLLIAGKGHETGQIIGSIVKPFSDHEAVRAALAEAPLNA
jgi:UDP-N-acetylmuramoyl-L-alanyl-D-glutamate--2,6-diaminopimelate ligase